MYVLIQKGYTVTELYTCIFLVQNYFAQSKITNETSVIIT